mmetsp:Transcript_22603/g.65051  ORF Transcript_22603/g.65051 Transcript_22603/m.65051 type:complete len:212 (+) Transcript_22603:2337-2972(+)
MVLVPYGNRGNIVPIGIGIFQQGSNIITIDVVGNVQSHQLHQSGIDGLQIDGFVADRSGLRHTRNHPNEGHVTGLLPKRLFLVMTLLSEVISVIRPQNNDGVVLLGRLLKGIEQSANVHVHVGNSRQVALNAGLPLAQRNDLGKLLVWVGNPVDGIFWNVGKILPNALLPVLPVVGGGVRRQLDLVGGEAIVVLLGHHPRKVRLHDATCQK